MDGATKEAVMSATDISCVSLNRMMSPDPALGKAWRAARTRRIREVHRVQFLDLVKHYRGTPVKVLRKIPGNEYQWLDRNDRNSLVMHLPNLSATRRFLSRYLTRRRAPTLQIANQAALLRPFSVFTRLLRLARTLVTARKGCC